MKEQDIRDIEDVIYEITHKRNKFYRQLVLCFVACICLGASAFLYFY